MTKGIYLEDFVMELLPDGSGCLLHNLVRLSQIHPILKPLVKTVDCFGESQIYILDKYKFLIALGILVKNKTIKSGVLRGILL